MVRLLLLLLLLSALQAPMVAVLPAKQLKPAAAGAACMTAGAAWLLSKPYAAAEYDHS
jgi:hypothetical protein